MTSFKHLNTESESHSSLMSIEELEQRLALARTRASAHSPIDLRGRLRIGAIKWIAISSVMTLVVAMWLAYELGNLGNKRLQASENVDSSIETLQKSLNDKIQKLEEREKAIALKEKKLSDKEKILSEQIVRYEKVLKDLRVKVAEHESQKDQNAGAMREVYERMDPKKASRILDEMDIEKSSKILHGMRGDKAAEILSRMSPDKARAITETSLARSNSPKDGSR